MKKYTLFVLFIVCSCAMGAHAQDFYLKVGAGYAFPMPGEKIDQSGNVLNGSVIYNNGVTATHTKNASFTAGFQGIAGAGLMFSKNIGVELNAAADIAPRKFTETEQGSGNSIGYYTYQGVRQGNRAMLLEPSLVMQTANEKWNIYTRIGLALPLNTGIKMHETYTYTTGQVDMYDWTIQNYFSLGFTGAAGLKMKISDHVAIWAEVSMLYLNLARKERDMTTASIDGRSYAVSQLTGVTKYHYTKNGNTDQYGNAPSYAQPFSNLGVGIGASFSFNKKVKAATGGKPARHH